MRERGCVFGGLIRIPGWEWNLAGKTVLDEAKFVIVANVGC